MSLSSVYMEEINRSLSNNHDNNWDYLRYGADQPVSPIRTYYDRFSTRLRTKRRNRIAIKSFAENIHFFEFLYDNLQLKSDKDLLVKVMAYRTLGHKKVKLPLNNSWYWDTINRIESILDKSRFVSTRTNSEKLYLADLAAFGYPIRLYFSTSGINADFIIKQYEYNNEGVSVKADLGDVVIDCGGCWGDAALYFANEIGPKGQVYSFEFVPENISVFKENVSLNKSFSKIIKLIERPLWDNSFTELYLDAAGPGSSVNDITTNRDSTSKVQSTCIDEEVRNMDVQSVDFIKMDIEGAEIHALNGARETLMKYKPKLAIALYHRIDDFEKIPRLIKSLVPEYKFFFSHSTIHEEESILFAKL
jgi:FkbM family methyltransferase